MRIFLAMLFAALSLARPAAARSDDVLIPVAGQASAALSATNAPDDAFDQVRVFTEAMLMVRKYYVTDKSYEDLIRGAMRGMLESLDAHSEFMNAEAREELQEDTAGKFSGVGINLGSKNGVLTVIAPIEDTPAFRAGIQAGDVITAINSNKTERLEMKDAVKQLRGDTGSGVTLTIRRQGSAVEQTFELERAVIAVPSIKGVRMLRGEIGYIRIVQFSDPTAELLQKALAPLVTNNLAGLVLDLRNNPGGLLTSAIEVAQQFLPAGALIVSTQGRKGLESRTEGVAGGTVHYTNFPMVVLVNRGSASASEIVAGALHDHRRAVLIGETTFGKGSVQGVLPLSSDPGCALRLTIAHYYTPAGRMIQDAGLDPDIPIDVSMEEWIRVQRRRAHLENPELFTEEARKADEAVVDRQLERALDVLQALKVFK
jgi:carboxyl-terminal processing protease